MTESCITIQIVSSTSQGLANGTYLLVKLDDRVLYYDTDSVIYISRPGEWDVPISSFLGEMTDELKCYGEGSYITTFASGGPKLYAYRVYSPAQSKYHDTIKVKGITINHNTSKIVNFQTLCDMVLKEGEADEPTYVTTKQISRTAMHEVVTKTGRKIFRCNFRKRKLVQDNNSVPYGYTKTGRKIFRCNFRKRKLVQDNNSVPYGYKSRKLE
ncbi:hypothetical protein QE152_g15964 [Popillia japonica]|uniref:DNA-directed DNA polymerase n=1 Tax=Popillia japonica TaxID=7064 RepID=A0AAW1L7E2_POPJA